MREKIVVMGGSFNPPTIAHQRLMLGAVETLGAARGIFVPSSHAYVSAKMRRDKHRNEVLPEEARLRMLLAMAADDPRLEVEDCEFHRAERSYTYESMEAVQEKYPEAELYFVAGGDKTAVISRWHRIREFLERFRIVLVRRDDYEAGGRAEAEPLSERASGQIQHDRSARRAGWRQLLRRARKAQGGPARRRGDAAPGGLGDITGICRSV